jgi:hypothetical protein
MTEEIEVDGHGAMQSPEALVSFRRAPRISQEDVFGAADELLIEGHRPTIDRVRMRLGRGSPNTINDHLDAWWARLGARLRDVPGREFPQLPERVAASLQRLWNDALEGAHEALKSTIEGREQSLAERESALEARQAQHEEAERIAAARQTALEDNLVLTRTQLAEANRRGESLEQSLRDRDSALGQLRERLEKLEMAAAKSSQKLEAERAAHLAERSKLESRYDAAEQRWLAEVDRARQDVKEGGRQRQSLTSELARQTKEGEQVRRELAEARSALRASAEVRSQLEERIKLLSARGSGNAVRKATGRVVRTQIPKRLTPRKRSQRAQFK